jgi:hypothetical protein
VEVSGHLDGIAVDLLYEDPAGPEGGAEHGGFITIQLDVDADGIRVGGVGDGHLLEFVIEAFALSDLERFTEPLIVGAEAEQTADEGFVSAMSFTSTRKGAMQLEESGLRGSTEQTSGEQPEPARAGGVRRGRADHYRADYIE